MRLWLLVMLAVLAISHEYEFGGSSTDASSSCDGDCKVSQVDEVTMPVNGEGGEVLSLRQFKEIVIPARWVAVYDLTVQLAFRHMYRWVGQYSGPDSNGNYQGNFNASLERNNATCTPFLAEYVPRGDGDDDDDRDVFMEKHWKSVVHKSICDYFFEAQTKAGTVDDVPPIIPTPHHYLINIYRNQLYFVAVITTEVPPLFVIEFLHRVVDTFEDYFQGCSESILKEHYVIVYEILDEMLDNGFPLAVESNILKELIKPPNFLRTIADTITGKTTGVSGILPTGQLSNIPWRRTGVKYTNNEAYFDIIEEVDAIIDKSGSTVIAEIQGYIDSLVKLTGMPDLTLSFINPRLLDDVSFHPCVRFKRWENEKILSFVPPDGNFRLLSYHIGTNNMVAIPVSVRHNIFYREGTSGRFDISISTRQTMGKTVENLVVECPFPKTVLNVTLTPNQGKYTFDPVSKVMSWTVGRIESTKTPNIKGTINLQTGSPVPESNPTLSLHFSISTMAMSGIKVNRLDMYGEKYKPFKGVKYLTKAGRFQVRT